MSRNVLVGSLSTLADLRGREVDRLSADMAQKETVRQRYRSSIERLVGLCSTAGVSESLPALSINRAEYKQSVLRMVAQHREDLTLHEADMAVTQRLLTAASHKREVLGQVLAKQQRLVRAEQGRREQKVQDELASQLRWRVQR